MVEWFVIGLGGFLVLSCVLVAVRAVLVGSG